MGVLILTGDLAPGMEYICTMALAASIEYQFHSNNYGWLLNVI